MSPRNRTARYKEMVAKQFEILIGGIQVGSRMMQAVLSHDQDDAVYNITGQHKLSLSATGLQSYPSVQTHLVVERQRRRCWRCRRHRLWLRLFMLCAYIGDEMEVQMVSMSCDLALWNYVNSEQSRGLQVSTMLFELIVDLPTYLLGRGKSGWVVRFS